MKNLLTREEAAEYLRSIGFKTSKVTLAKMAMYNNGPKYAIIRKSSYYTQEWLDEWLESQLKPQTGSRRVGR